MIHNASGFSRSSSTSRFNRGDGSGAVSVLRSIGGFRAGF
jgi:hypothetical protein